MTFQVSTRKCWESSIVLYSSYMGNLAYLGNLAWTPRGTLRTRSSYAPQAHPSPSLPGLVSSNAFSLTQAFTKGRLAPPRGRLQPTGPNVLILTLFQAGSPCCAPARGLWATHGHRGGRWPNLVRRHPHLLLAPSPPCPRPPPAVWLPPPPPGTSPGAQPSLSRAW
jgi:hypothetical protein